MSPRTTEKPVGWSDITGATCGQIWTCRLMAAPSQHALTRPIAADVKPDDDDEAPSWLTGQPRKSDMGRNDLAGRSPATTVRAKRDGCRYLHWPALKGYLEIACSSSSSNPFIGVSLAGCDR